ncbi:MAG TPA: response regulator [Acidobacteriota bacterium]|jgi:two-component system chemotaxis response regulator CheY|nr:response regulator [Acidobacteriota bacterium]
MSQTVLIVDDSRLARATIRKYLVAAGFAIAGEAGNGREALEMFDQLSPNLVTLDITMPEIDGLTAFREIRKRDPNAAVLLVTSLDQKFIAEEVENDPHGAFLPKPFSSYDLLKAVRALLQLEPSDTSVEAAGE